MKPGYAFGEHVKTEKLKKRNYNDGTPKPFHSKGYLLPFVLIVVGIVLFFKLFSLQIIHGNDYRRLSDVNRMRTQVIHAPRGVVFDRNGVPLVFNIPGFRQVTRDPKGKQPTKAKVITKEEALRLLAKGAQNIEVDSLRKYPYTDATAHLLGYIGQISPEDIKDPDFADYQPTDWIGKSGIEKQFEHTLRGQDGHLLIEVDAYGKAVRILGKTDPISGQDVTLTIDSKLQQRVYAAAKDIPKGAIVVSKPDGEILSLVSKPSFDPNLFTLDKTYKASSTSAFPTIQSMLTDTKSQPLLNRAIGGTYPPGSTFKIITAVAGLEDHTIDEKYRVIDTGVLKVGDFSFANWFYTEYGKKEPGELDITRALARSNDIFFYKLAEKIGVDKLSAMAKRFGVGEILGIDLEGESHGLVPTEDWKRKTLKENWFLGDTYHYGIGQGYLLTTPLQVNSWAEVIANGGTLYQPRLVKSQESRIKKKGLVSEKTRTLVRQGMIQACSTGGVAFPLFDLKVKNAKLKVDGKNFLSVASSSADMRKISVACKTGTAQHGGETTKPHAWITLFAPAYKPEVVVTVLVESSGEGSSVAAPIAKKVLEAYFKP